MLLRLRGGVTRLNSLFLLPRRLLPRQVPECTSLVDGASMLGGTSMLEGARLLGGAGLLLLHTSNCLMNVARCRSLLVSLANKLSLLRMLGERTRSTHVACRARLVYWLCGCRCVEDTLLLRVLLAEHRSFSFI